MKIPVLVEHEPMARTTRLIVPPDVELKPVVFGIHTVEVVHSRDRVRAAVGRLRPRERSSLTLTADQRAAASALPSLVSVHDVVDAYSAGDRLLVFALAELARTTDRAGAVASLRAAQRQLGRLADTLEHAREADA